MTALVAIADAVKLRLATAGIKVLSQDDPSLLSEQGDFAMVYVSTRGAGQRTEAALSNRLGYRLQVRMLSKSELNPLDMMDDAHAEFYGKRLIVNDRRSSPFAEPITSHPSPDEGWFTSLIEWTFTFQ